MTKRIIDFENLEYYIKKIEKFFEKESINIEEQDLLLNQLRARIAKKRQKQRLSDATQMINFKDMFTRAKKTMTEE